MTKSPSQLPAAADVTDDDVLLGNDGTVTKQFPATALKAYAGGAALGGSLFGTVANAQIGAGNAVVDFPADGGGNRSLRVSRTTDSTIGAVGIGSAGAGLTTIAGGTNLYIQGDSAFFRSIDATKIPLQVNARFGPGIIATPDGGQHAIRAVGNLQHTSGGRLRKTTTVTANYNMNYFTDDVIFANAAGITITLPRADFAEAGREYLVKNLSAGSVTVDVAASGGTIDGAASVTLAAAEALAVISTGTNFGRV